MYLTFIEPFCHVGTDTDYDDTMTGLRNTVAWLSWASNGEIDFELIWKQQAISKELMGLTETWTDKVDAALRESAGNRMPSEWAKKSDCRDEMRELFPRLSRRPPPEFGATAAAMDRTVASSQT